MSAQGILSADMPTVRRWLAQGWQWWVDQLSAMVPDRGLLRRNRGILLESAPDDPAGWVTVTAGQSVLALSARQARGAVIALRPEELLCRTIPTPVLASGDLRQMLALDIDRLGPFPVGMACFDCEVVERDTDRLSVRIAMLPRARVETWLAQLAQAGVAPARIALRDDAGDLHFDFVRALGLGGKGSGAWRWWLLVAVLFALNVGALVWRDVALVDTMRLAVEEQAPAGRTALLIRQRIGREQQRRGTLVRERDRHDPLRAIAAVSAVLPRGAWVQRLSWDGRELRVVGFAGGDADPVEALRASPLLRAVTENDGDGLPPASADQMRPFDISARMAEGGR